MIKKMIGADCWLDRASACREIQSRITVCNERRLHSSIGDRYPTETEPRGNSAYQPQDRRRRCEKAIKLQVEEVSIPNPKRSSVAPKTQGNLMWSDFPMNSLRPG
jgi:hypothetical protein